MRKIGVIAGFSAESTQLYYLSMTRYARALLGAHNTPDIILHHVNPTPIITAFYQKNFDFIVQSLLSVSQRLIAHGAECIVLPCNSLHICLQSLMQLLPVPVINIMDSLGRYACLKNMKKLLLLGTVFTMQNKFYKSYLQKFYHISVCLPTQSDQNFLHQLIFNELCVDNVSKKSRDRFFRLCAHHLLHDQLDGVLLGCTELSLLVSSQNAIPFVDPLRLHVKDIIAFSLPQG